MASIAVLPILGITWVLGLFAVNENTLLFAYLFTVFNSLQVPSYISCIVVFTCENSLQKRLRTDQSLRSLLL